MIGVRAAARNADALLLALLLAGGLALCGRAAFLRGAGAEPAAGDFDPAAAIHRVDLATAGDAELRLLPGVGPRLAERILEERAAGGPFASPADVARRVPGVGPVRLRWWKGRIVESGADREDPR